MAEGKGRQAEVGRQLYLIPETIQGRAFLTETHDPDTRENTVLPHPWRG